MTTDGKKRNRRTTEQMIEAVKAVKHLMLTDGLPEKTARYRFRISKQSFDYYNELLRKPQAGQRIPDAYDKKAWECPRCGRINAPFMPWCDCKRSSAA